MKRILFTLAFASLSLCAAAQVPTNGLVGWYPFNRTPNDATGFGNNGTATSTTLVSDRFGLPSAAYSFNGTNSRIVIPVNDSLRFNNLLDNYSVVFWVKSADPNLGATSCRVLEHRSATGSGYPFSFIANATTNVLTAQAFDGSNVSATVFGGQPFDGNWHMLTMVVDNAQDSVFAYLDDIRVGASQNNLSQASTLSDTLTLGNDRNGARPYAGELDDLRIYSRAISPAEVSALYHENLCFQTITVTDTLIINANLTGFNPVSYQHTIKVYPNPIADHITIDYGDFVALAGYTLQIQNSLGQSVFTTAITQQQSYLNLSTWTGNGIYFVHLIDAQGQTVEVRKIVLQ